MKTLTNHLIENEIITSPKGNTYVGPLANRFVSRLKLPPLFRLCAGQFHVFEVMGADVIHRATQSTREAAAQYMNENRVLVTEGGVL